MGIWDKKGEQRIAREDKDKSLPQRKPFPKSQGLEACKQEKRKQYCKYLRYLV